MQELALALWFVHHLFCQMGTATFTATCSVQLAGSRLAPKNVIWGRATRAYANYVGNLVAFAALDLGLLVTHHTASYGADGQDRSARVLCRSACSTSSTLAP